MTICMRVLGTIWLGSKLKMRPDKLLKQLGERLKEKQ